MANDETSSGNGAAFGRPQRKIVVVDDCDSVRAAMMAQLVRLGFATRGAADGLRGLEEIRRERPDLVLCDLRMPNMDGLEFLKAARSFYSDLPVIVMSGAGLFGDAVGALKLGAWDYIEKPLPEIAALEHAVGKALEKAALLDENRRYRMHLEKVNGELSASLQLLADDEEAGRQIQFRMLPRNHQVFGNFEFSRDLVPSAFLSGDFIDAFSIDERRFGFYLADVSGHGVSSALVTVVLRTFVQRQVADYVRLGDPLILSPSSLLERLNEDMAKENLDKHLTMFYGVIDLAEDTLVYANAGHFPWPILHSGDETVELEQPGVPVGLVRRTRYPERRLTLPPQMVLAVFSDGLLEVLPQGDLRRKVAFLRTLFGRHDVTVEKLHDDLRLSERRPLPDDVAILLIKRGDSNGSAEHDASVLRKR